MTDTVTVNRADLALAMDLIGSRSDAYPPIYRLRAALAAPAEDAPRPRLVPVEMVTMSRALCHHVRLLLIGEYGKDNPTVKALAALTAAAPALPEPAQDRETRIEALAKALCSLSRPCGAHRADAERALDWVEAQR